MIYRKGCFWSFERRSAWFDEIPPTILEFESWEFPFMSQLILAYELRDHLAESLLLARIVVDCNTNVLSHQDHKWSGHGTQSISLIWFYTSRDTSRGSLIQFVLSQTDWGEGGGDVKPPIWDDQQVNRDWMLCLFSQQPCYLTGCED